jgi:hypothetical protein
MSGSEQAGAEPNANDATRLAMFDQFRSLLFSIHWPTYSSRRTRADFRWLTMVA